MARRRLHKRYRKNPDSAPAGASMSVSELIEWIGPGFAAFAAARFVTYLATGQIEKRKPAWGRHAGAIAAVGTFVAAWMLAHRVKFLSKWVEPIVIGTGIAGAQSVVQLYMPKLGWMVGDPTVAAHDATQAAVAAAQPSSLPPGFSELDEDPSIYDNTDTYDGGIFASNPQPSAAQQQQQQGAPTDDDLMSELDMGAGIFAGA